MTCKGEEETRVSGDENKVWRRGKEMIISKRKSESDCELMLQSRRDSVTVDATSDRHVYCII